MTAPTPNGASGESERCDPVADGQTFSGVRCELCGVVRMNAMESRDGVVRCQDSFICEQVAALVAGARSTYDDLIEAGWRPVTTAPVPASGESERCDNYLPPMTCWTAPSTETGRCGYCSAHPAAPAPVPVGSPQDEDVSRDRVLDLVNVIHDVLGERCPDENGCFYIADAALASGLVVTRAAADRMQAEAVEAALRNLDLERLPKRLAQITEHRDVRKYGEEGTPFSNGAKRMAAAVEAEFGACFDRLAAAARARTEGSDRG